jgi:hypothetical protein
MRVRRLGGWLAGIALALGFLHGAARAEPAPAREEPALDISLHDGLVTLTINDVPLAEVLRALGEQTGVSVQLRGTLATLVDADFTDVPLDEVIKRLARGHSVCLLYGAAPRDDGVRLTEAWVIESPARGPLPVPASRVPDARRTGERAQAVATLTRMLLDDASPAVRAQAAMELLRLRDAAAAHALTTALRRDPSSRVRRLAVRGLAALRTEDARAAVEAAADDEDAAVRAEVARALARWVR